MPRKALWLAVTIAFICAVLAIAGLRRVAVWTLEPTHYLVDLHYGQGAMDMGRAVGLDGRTYGPLGFATNGQRLVIADTYRQRILSLSPKAHVVSVPGMMIEDVAVDPRGHIVAVDNRTLTVWRLIHGHRRALVHLTPAPGYTEAIWHIGVSSSGKIYVEWVRFGHGSFAIILDEYSRSGVFMRQLARAGASRGRGLTPLSGAIQETVRDFQVAPNNNVYVEPPSLDGHTRTILIYGPRGQLLRQILVRADVVIRQSELLGVTNHGLVYLGVNLSSPHHARILAVNEKGVIVINRRVPSVPMYAAVYGQALADGVLYLNQSTQSQYRIQEWRPRRRRVWRFVGFGR